MIVKEVLEEELLTLAEARDILNEVFEARGPEAEILYEQRRAINHANMFANVSSVKARELVEKLQGLEKMKTEIAIRIADLLPRSRDEVRAIYAKERFTLTDEELETILGLVDEALE